MIDATDPKTRQPSRLWLQLYGFVHRRRVPVSGHADASDKLTAFMTFHGYGQNDVQAGNGDVIDMNGSVVFRVSPNGKVWDARPYPQCECLYDPYARETE
jgi:hypothetical protein